MGPSLALYFTDAEGKRWRVYDTVFGPPLAKLHKHKRLELGDPRATARIFVPPDPEPMMRSFDFCKGADRSLTTAILAEQFRRAGYAPRRYQPPARRPPGTPLGM